MPTPTPKPMPSRKINPRLAAYFSRGVVAGLAVIVLAACGQATGAGGAPGAGPGAAISGPTNVAVGIDDTTVKSSRVLAERIKARAQQVVDPVLVNGGHVRVSLFAQAGVAPVDVIDEQVPTTADLSGIRRDNFLITARANLGSLLDQALGLAARPADSALTAQLAAMPAGGSDPAGMIRTLVSSLRQDGGGALVGLGDGLQRSQGVDFSKDLDGESAAQAAAAVAPLMPHDAAGVAIWLYGVGNAGTDTTRTLRSIKAQSAWTLACRQAHAAACEVSPTV